MSSVVRTGTGSRRGALAALPGGALPALAALLLTALVAVAVLVPSARSVAVVDIPSLPPGPQADAGTIYGYYPNATVEVRAPIPPAAAQDAAAVLAVRVRPADGWTGFGIVTRAVPARDAVLRIRWRCSGRADHVQIDVQEHLPGGGGREGELFSAIVPFTAGDWVTVPLPLHSLPPNRNCQPDPTAVNGILDVDRIGRVAFTFPPGTDATVEIASLRFAWTGAKWTAVGALAVALLLVLLLEIARLTARKLEAQSSLRATEATYLAIFNGVRDGIWVLDPDSRLTVDANRAACELLELPREEMLGRPFAALAAHVGDTGSEAPVEERLTGEPGEWECRIENRSGKAWWAELRAAPAAIGSRRRLLVAARDVSERREAERERAQLEHRLVQSQKMEALGQLAGGVAHDFNNILTGITLAADVALLRGSGGPDPATSLRRIRDLAVKATSLTQQMLTFSRRQPLRPAALRLGALVSGAIEMLHRLIGEDIEISFAAQTSEDVIRADRGQLEQVLVNLAVNARDAMPQGGSLVIRTRAAGPGEAPPGTPADTPCVVLEVVDSGHGMDEAVRERIFEPFFTTKEKGKGTGLGLSTVYGIVARHGGTIAVDSRSGSGTAFRLCFPTLPGEEEAAPAPTSAAVPSPRGSELILIVEDDRDVCQLLDLTLAQLGYRTTSAECPAQAEPIYRARRNELGLLLSDVVMPGESGPQFYRRLAIADPGLKVVFMSGYADARSGCEEILRDGLPFISKPFDPTELATLIRRTLDQPWRPAVPAAPATR